MGEERDIVSIGRSLKSIKKVQKVYKGKKRGQISKVSAKSVMSTKINGTKSREANRMYILEGHRQRTMSESLRAALFTQTVISDFRTSIFSVL